MLITLLLSTSALAAPPTTESVIKLLNVTGSKAQVETMHVELEKYLAASIKDAAQQYRLSPSEEKKVASLIETMMEELRAEISWEKMSSLFVQVYAESFSQEEIDNLIAFYESPTGQMFVAKVPQVMQRSMALMQQRMKPTLQKIQAKVQRELQEVQSNP
ncbi:DUF2059 domain-containing protein [Hydrocarboniclastica marina]|uniref:DUF2059 domain-containing protein n=1 Tax=Hydrocarboniclastica marina TaxID=2259620 RepID=A0A4P7XLY7_9ALTE|nr:DUF2059 domain-containing protein [Hydrocarboniclastica marina]